MEDLGKVILCHTDGSLKQHLLKAEQYNKLVVVNIYAKWCGPCRVMAPIVEELAKKMSNVIFLKVDVDELTSIAEEFEVSSIPSFQLFKNGNLVDKLEGANKKDVLQNTVSKHAA